MDLMNPKHMGCQQIDLQYLLLVGHFGLLLGLVVVVLLLFLLQQLLVQRQFLGFVGYFELEFDFGC